VLVISYHIETLPVVSVSELFYNKVHLTLLFTSCQLAVKRYSYTSSSFLMFLFLVFTLSAPLLHLTFYFLIYGFAKVRIIHLVDGFFT